MNIIRDLTLTSFRNYESHHFDDLDNQYVILIGDNGAGKTNCLEAISLLSPGRGLRGAGVMDCQSSQCPTPWAVSALIKDFDHDLIRLGVGRDPQRPDKKIIRANGETIKNQDQLGEILRCVWLTPQMDGLFLQGASERRRFFDRLVAIYDSSHTGRMTRYERAMRERLNILKQATEKKIAPDALWLDGLENIMSESYIAIAAARIEMLHKLQQTIQTEKTSHFPKAILLLDGEAETLLQQHSALKAEDMIKENLCSMRHHDGIVGRTNCGAHKTDLTVIYDDKGVNAAQCSTGEQKALLTTIILAHAHMIAARFGAAPILLFDEVAAHFDAKRRDALFDILSGFKTQIWLSGQDESSFQTIQNKIIQRI